MKTCNICKEEKELSLFSIRTDTFKYRNTCTKCWNKQSSAYHVNNRDRVLRNNKIRYEAKVAANPNLHAEYYAANKEKVQAEARKYYINNREKRLAAVKEWASNNRSKCNAMKKAYKATKIKACPEWVRNDPDLMWMMDEAYDLAQLRTKMLGFAWQVDHIVPLRGKTVCGLHVPWNLQVISAAENNRKSNKLLEV